MDFPENLVDISRRRASPGMLLFDLGERLLFLNDEAQQILPRLTAECEGDALEAPAGILALLGELREADGSLCMSGDTPCTVLQDSDGVPYAFRAFPYSQDGQEGDATHVMVLAERIIPRHEPDFTSVKATYSLTRREVEVLKEIHSGKATKIISDILCISEYTVKDHVKNIMQKMEVRSRSELLSLL